MKLISSVMTDEIYANSKQYIYIIWKNIESEVKCEVKRKYVMKLKMSLNKENVE